jgi:Tfp pilus assembly protein PilP
MTTEAGRRAALQEEQKAAEAKAKEAAAKSGKPAEEIKNTAPKTSGFIIEKGDPFAIPIKSAPTASAPQDRPPGLAGLMVSQIDLQGIVKMVGGNRAVVQGPHDRTYFLKVNDKVYNARVTKITDDTIYFEETSVDPMGKVMKRELTKSMPSDAKKP